MQSIVIIDIVRDIATPPFAVCTPFAGGHIANTKMSVTLWHQSRGLYVSLFFHTYVMHTNALVSIVIYN